MIITDYTKAKNTIDEKTHAGCYIEITEARGKSLINYDIKVVDSTRVHLIEEVKNFGKISIDHEQPIYGQLYGDLKTYFPDAVDYIQPVVVEE